jgi:hypothetical protein
MNLDGKRSYFHYASLIYRSVLYTFGTKLCSPQQSAFSHLEQELYHYRPHCKLGGKGNRNNYSILSFLTAVGIRHAGHLAPSIRKSWH